MSLCFRSALLSFSKQSTNYSGTRGNSLAHACIVEFVLPVHSVALVLIQLYYYLLARSLSGSPIYGRSYMTCFLDFLAGCNKFGDLFSESGESR